MLIVYIRPRRGMSGCNRRHLMEAADTPQWFVLNHVPNSSSRKASAKYAVELFNRSGKRLELFAPEITQMNEVDGKIVSRSVPLTFHYVFVRGILSDVRELCSRSNGFSFILNRGSEDRYLTVDNRRMSDFMLIARAYQNQLPFYSISDINLEDGDLVEIVDGAFAGLTGVYLPRKKSSSGNIVLALDRNVGSVICDVNARYVRVLEFSPKSKRPYDIIDAFVPRMLSALGNFYTNGTLTSSEKSALSIFCRRMDSAVINNPRLNSKLQSLLSCAYTVLGDFDKASEARKRLSAIGTTASGGWSDALRVLLEAIPERNIDALRAAYEPIRQLTPDSTAKKLIKSEYCKYLNI